MKKVLAILLSTIILASCSIKEIPIAGTYQKTPVVITSTKSFDQVWDKLIDLFAQRGISIKLIDRSSGLIVSDKTVLQATIEDKNGSLVEPRALIVVPKYKDGSTGRYLPITGSISGPYATKVDANPVYGDWNVRIKKTDTGCTINVNIVNVFFYERVNVGYSAIEQARTVSKYQTTGIFENDIANFIK